LNIFEFQHDLFPLLAHKFQEALNRDQFPIINFFSDLYHPRVMMLVYDVELVGGLVPNQIVVEYVMLGSWSRWMTPTIYTYAYLTNPAKNFASFGDLTIELLLPDDIPYIIESSLQFDMQELGTYRYVGVGLPETNLRFVICSSNSPVQRSNPYVLLFLLFVGILLIPIVVGGIGVFLLVRSIRKDEKKWRSSKTLHHHNQ
jgi:hypothetical protein